MIQGPAITDQIRESEIEHCPIISCDKLQQHAPAIYQSSINIQVNLRCYNLVYFCSISNNMLIQYFLFTQSKESQGHKILSAQLLEQNIESIRYKTLKQNSPEV